MQYKVISFSGPEDLEAKLTSLALDGWVVHTVSFLGSLAALLERPTPQDTPA